MNDRLQRLEEKVAYLERHVTEQDKVMMDFGDQLAKLKQELKVLRDRSADSSGASSDEKPANERPPHY